MGAVLMAVYIGALATPLTIGLIKKNKKK